MLNAVQVTISAMKWFPNSPPLSDLLILGEPNIDNSFQADRATASIFFAD